VVNGGGFSKQLSGVLSKGHEKKSRSGERPVRPGSADSPRLRREKKGAEPGQVPAKPHPNQTLSRGIEKKKIAKGLKNVDGVTPVSVVGDRIRQPTLVRRDASGRRKKNVESGG